MIIVLVEGDFDKWLHATPTEARTFLRPYPAEMLTAKPVPKDVKAPASPKPI